MDLDDQPPPRKRSRFFDNGKSKIGRISDSLSSGPISCNDSGELPSHSGVDRSRISTKTANHTRQDSITESEQDTDIEDEYDDVEKHSRGGKVDDDKRDQENAQLETTLPPALDQLSVKTKRPKAIYGVHELLPPNAATQDIQTTIFGKRSTVEDPSNNKPLIEQNLDTEHQQFTFRANRPVGTYIPNQPQQDLGHGLAEFAQQTYHHDNGPISGSQLRRGSLPRGSFPRNTFPTGYPPGVTGYVDTDRDAYGRRLPTNYDTSHYMNIAGGGRPVNFSNTGITSLPFARYGPALSRITNPDALVPDNMYHAPGRIQHARYCAQVSRKRKRPGTILPPPAYIYQRTDKPDFNILNAFMLYPELLYTLASHLPVKDLENLYSISKDFHTLIDARFTTVILSQAVRKAPESARTFQFRCYKWLCRDDPASRIPHPNINLAQRSIARKIPSFRWLKMILHREKVVHELMTIFAEDGVPLPFRCRLALKRMWFILDIPDNARRIGLIHQSHIISDLDLYFLACFFVKLDMRLNDPTRGEKSTGLRKLLLTQRSLTTMLQFLKREIWPSRFDTMKEWIRCRHTPAPHEAGMSLFGIPADKIGTGKLEYWGMKTAEQIGRPPAVLLRPDTLVVREACRRRLPFDKHYVRFLLYGYVRPDTLENYEPRTYGRRIDGIQDDEYAIDDLVGGVAALGVDEKGCDPLLDLGKPRIGSVFSIVKQDISKEEKELRSKQVAMAELCVQWWERERSCAAAAAAAAAAAEDVS